MKKNLPKIILLLILIPLSYFLGKISTEKDNTQASKQIQILHPEKEARGFENCHWQKLIRVVDGDTIIVEKNERIRLLGIDTPESVIPDQAPERYGIKAANFTKKLLENSAQVCLIYPKIGEKTGSYGRTLAYIYSQEGHDVNAELLKNGLAEIYRKSNHERYQEFLHYQNQAKKLELNIWE